MKYFLHAILFLIFSSGCSYKNAYTSFDINTTTELFESNTQSVKISSKEQGVQGIISATYLNNIYKNRFSDEEVFLISLYLKDKDVHYKFLLNNKEHLRIEDINSSHQEWKDNFKIVFKKSLFSDLNLTFDNGQLNSAVIKYQKERE